MLRTYPMEDRINLLARLARLSSGSRERVDAGTGNSILSLAANSYSVRPSEDATVPTGFDPQAVALFEAIVEGAYLVATADGVFDAEEHLAFERVVVEACGGTVVQRQITRSSPTSPTSSARTGWIVGLRRWPARLQRRSTRWRSSGSRRCWRRRATM